MPCRMMDHREFDQIWWVIRLEDSYYNKSARFSIKLGDTKMDTEVQRLRPSWDEDSEDPD